jgi:hypothetical protein
MHRLAPSRILIALAAVMVLVPFVLVAGSTSVQAANLKRAATYTCQYTGVEAGVAAPGGLPTPVLPALGGSDPVKVEVQVKAPSEIAPGEPLKLSGTTTFTFGTNATATNASTVFTFLSDSFGVDAAVAGQHRFLRIASLKTTTSTVDSAVVTAKWTLPDYLVPSTASGQLTLSMPHEALATNPVSTSPESVAFTGKLLTDSTIQPTRTVACALDAGQDTAIGAVKVAGEPVVEPSESASEEPAPPTVGGGGLPAPGVDPAAPVASAPPPGTAETAAPGAVSDAVLAGEPIPPATVEQGLRLPAWAMLFVGAFLAGGLFLAVSSRRRLRLLAAAAVLGLFVVPTPLNPPTTAEAAPAAAAAGQAQVTLICVYEAQGSDPSDVPKDQPTGVSLTLDVPASVTPGEVLTLTGSASVQAPEDIRAQASQLGYTTLDAISDAFSVGLTVGSGSRQVFVADRWQTGKTAFSNPLVVRGALYFPAFKVPDDASGSIKLELPRNEVVDRRPKPYQNAHTPPKVAVEFQAVVTGNGTSATYIVSCWRNDDGAGLIASIPVVKESATTPTTPGTTPTTGSTAPATGGATPPPATGAGQPVTPADGATGAVSPGTVVPGTAPGAATNTVPQLQGATAAAAPAPAASQDVVVPTWLALLAVLFAAGTYGYAGWNRLRLRATGNRPTP